MVERLGFVVSSVAKSGAGPATVEPDPLKAGDVYKWAFEQAEHLRAGRFELVDLPNVIDEIETVGRSEFSSFRSNLRVVLAHLLKWDHQPQRRSRSWANTIGEHRDRVLEDLNDSPSMARRRDEAILEAYESARRKASRETRIALTEFPLECPYSWSDIMEKPYELDRERS